MPDYLFFPAAGVALAVMAFVAIAPGPEHRREAMAAMGDPEHGLLIQGDTLNFFQIPEGLSLDLIEAPDGRTAARLAAFKPYDLPPPSAGAFLALPADFEAAFAGKTITVNIEARRSDDNGSPHLLLSYFGGAGQSPDGWQEIQLDSETRAYQLQWTLPERTGDTRSDYIGIWPDPEGQGRSIELVRVAAWVSGQMPPVALRAGRDR